MANLATWDQHDQHTVAEYSLSQLLTVVRNIVLVLLDLLLGGGGLEYDEVLCGRGRQRLLQGSRCYHRLTARHYSRFVECEEDGMRCDGVERKQLG